MKAKLVLAGGLVLVLAATTLIPLMNSCNNNGKGNGPDTSDKTAVPPPLSMSYSIGSIYPHDTSSFTEGLTMYKGELYEGTGNYGFSKLMKVDLKTGKPLKQVSLDSKYFGEGITILHDTIYQLTYREKVAFAYTLKDFKKVKEFQFETQTKEGWGLTNDGKNLIASDGSNILYYYDPGTFKLIKTLQVTEGGNLAYNINELEYIDGYIYANQWTLSYILKIDPNGGKVVGKINISELWKKIREKEPTADVPNGIAYDSVSKKVFITGKHWPELYEIQFSK